MEEEGEVVGVPGEVREGERVKRKRRKGDKVGGGKRKKVKEAEEEGEGEEGEEEERECEGGTEQTTDDDEEDRRKELDKLLGRGIIYNCRFNTPYANNVCWVLHQER